MKTQYTDEFGGYSKTWFADGLDQVKNSEQLFDMPMEEEEAEEVIVKCVEPASKENNQDYGMDCLARNLGLDIEALARSLAMNNDGRKPIQCLDVEEDPAELRKNDESKDEEPSQNNNLLKMQKVNEKKNEESKEQEEVQQVKKAQKIAKNHMPIENNYEADFLKDSR